MTEYKRLVNKVLLSTDLIQGRNGATKHITGESFRHNMSNGFPCLTIRELNYRFAITELRGFLQGQTKSEWFEKRGNNFWKKFPGQIIYGKQWTAWECNPGYDDEKINQFDFVLNELRTNPTSRRLLITAWNPVQIADYNLPPCHDSFQFLSNGKWLDLVWRQRSCDIAVGLPWDMMLYGFLLHVVAKEVKLHPRNLIGQFGSLHLYKKHEPQLIGIMQRIPFNLPLLAIAENMTFESFRDLDESIDLIGLVNYKAHPHETFEVIP